jgi:phosphopantetheine--protein transferase-like protein
MIKAGIDLVLNKRIEANVNNSEFLKKIFHPSELKHEKSKLAGIFVLKEAAMKALGKKCDWKSIEVLAKDGKKPEIFLSESIKPKKLKSIDASISHDGEYTIGMVVLEL